jgi:hypothetical protein
LPRHAFSHLPRRRLAAAGALLAPAAATADSIVYADQGDIWFHAARRGPGRCA